MTDPDKTFDPDATVEDPTLKIPTLTNETAQAFLEAHEKAHEDFQREAKKALGIDVYIEGQKVGRVTEFVPGSSGPLEKIYEINSEPQVRGKTHFKILSSELSPLDAERIVSVKEDDGEKTP
jgi:hypothetical protein